MRQPVTDLRKDQIDLLDDQLYLLAVGKAACETWGTGYDSGRLPYEHRCHAYRTPVSIITATREIPTPHAAAAWQDDEQLHDIPNDRHRAR